MTRTILVARYSYTDEAKDTATVSSLTLGGLEFSFSEPVLAKEAATAVTDEIQALSGQGLENIQVTLAAIQPGEGSEVVSIRMEIVANFIPYFASFSGSQIDQEGNQILRTEALEQPAPPISPEVQNLIDASGTWAFYQLFPAFYNPPQEEE